MAFRSLFSSPAKKAVGKPADKAQLKEIVRWVNGVLAPRKLEVRDVAEDFKDGVNLCNLLEVVSDSVLPKYKQRVIVHAQKQDNCDIAFKFMASSGLKLDFSADAIVKGEAVNTAELLQKIYIHFQFAKIAAAADPQAEPAASTTKSTAIKSVTAFVNRKLSSPVADLTGFGNGNRLCALVDSLAPEAGLTEKHKVSSLDGTKNAIEYADSKMGVPPLLDAEDFMSDQEEFTYCMYLAQFMAYKNGASNGVDHGAEAKKNEEEAKRKADEEEAEAKKKAEEEEAKKLAEVKKPPPPSPKTPKPPSAWTRVKDPERGFYYWNEATDETTWDMPAGFVDPDAPPAAVAASTGDSNAIESATIAATTARSEADAAKAKVETEKKTLEDAKVLSRAALDKHGSLVWKKVMSDNGTPYFWNERTDQTTWDRPSEYEDPPSDDDLKKLADNVSSAESSLSTATADADAAESKAVAAENALAALKSGTSSSSLPSTEAKTNSSDALAQKKSALDAAKERVTAAAAAETAALEAEAKAKADLLQAETAMHQAELERTTAESSHWTEVPADDGKCYYWNESTDETTWDKPSNFFSEAEKKTKIEAEVNAKNDHRAKADAVPTAEAAAATAVAAAKEAATAFATAETEYEEESKKAGSEPASSSTADTEAAEKKKAEDDAADKKKTDDAAAAAASSTQPSSNAKEAANAARDRVAKATSAVMATSEAESKARADVRAAEAALAKVVQDRAAAAISKWTEVPADDGKCYYWNESNDETTWDKPSGFFSETEKVKLAADETTAQEAVNAAKVELEKATKEADNAMVELEAADSAVKVAEAEEQKQGDLPPPPKPAEPAPEVKTDAPAVKVDEQEDKELAEAEAAVNAASKALTDAKEAANVAQKSAEQSETEAADATCTWTKVPADEGKFYFWNESNDETTWDVPQSYLDFEQRKQKAAEAKAFAKEALEKTASAQEALEKAEAAFKSLRVDKEERAKASSAASPTTASLEAFFTKPAAPAPAPAKRNPWTEVKDAEGKSYYWNEDTNATSWDKPAEFDEPKPEVDLLSGSSTADKPATSQTDEQKLLDMFSGTKKEESAAKDPFAGLDNFLAKPALEELTTALANAETEKAKKAKELEEAATALSVANNDVKTAEANRETKEREAETLSAEADTARRSFEKQPWTAVKADDGQVYYWNQNSDETAWDKPPGFVDEASVQKTADAAAAAKTEAAAAAEVIKDARKKADDAELKHYEVEKEHREAVTKEEQARSKLDSAKTDPSSESKSAPPPSPKPAAPKELTKLEQMAAKAATDERYAKLLERARSPWAAVKSDNGQSYYWNEKTDETTWDKPAAFVDVADESEVAAVVAELKQAEEEDVQQKEKQAKEDAEKADKDKEAKEAEEKALKEKEEAAAKEKEAEEKAKGSVDQDKIKEHADAALKAAADACKWSAVKTDNGQVYYWNKDTDETAWDKPAAFIDPEDPVTQALFLKDAEEAYSKSKAGDDAAKKEAEEKEAQAKKEAEEKEAKEKEEAQKAAAAKPKSKWTAVSDGSGKTYYWNEETDATTWDKPAELVEQEESEQKEKDAKDQKDKDAAAKQEKEKELKEQEDKVRAAASKWTGVQDAEGKTYYWNQDTDETSWDKPAIMVELEELEKARKARESDDDAAALAFLNSSAPTKTETLDKDSEAALLLKLEERAKGRSLGRRNTGLMLMGLEAKKAEDKIRRGSLPEDPGLNPELAVEIDGVAVAPVPSYADAGVRYDLQVSCSGLVKFKWLAAICPMVGVFGRSQADQPWKFLTRTEWLQSDTAPSFRVPVTIHDFPDQVQQLCFKVYCVDDSSVDEDDVMGWAETTMQSIKENARYRDTLTLTLQTNPGRSQDSTTAKIQIACRSTDVRSVTSSAGAAEIRHQALLRAGERTKRQEVLKGLQAPVGNPPSAEALARARANKAEEDLREIGGSAADEKTEDPDVNIRVRLDGYYLPLADSDNKLKLNITCSRLIKMDWLSLSDPIVALFAQERDKLLSQTEFQINEHDPVFKTPLALPIYDEDSYATLRVRVYDVDDEVVRADDLMGYVDVSLNELQASCFTNTPIEFALKHTNKRRQKRLDKKSSTITIQANYVP